MKPESGAKTIALLTAGGALCLGALLAVFVTPMTISSKSPAAETVDVRFGQYQHVYAVRTKRGMLVPWFSTDKNRGAITDLDGNAVEPSPVAEFPGCLSVEVEFDRSHNRGFKWIRLDGDEANVSSMSEKIHVLACRDAVPEFDAILAIS